MSEIVTKNDTIDSQPENKNTNTNTNTNITIFSGRPNLKAVVDSIQRKERTIQVSPNYLVDLVQYFESGTCFSYQMFHDAPKKLRKMDDLVQKTQHENALIKEQMKDLVVELTILQQTVTDLTEKEANFLQREEQSRIIQLPLKKITTFLALCHPEELTDTSSFFYVKVDKDGNMQRMVRKREEL